MAGSGFTLFLKANKHRQHCPLLWFGGQQGRHRRPTDTVCREPGLGCMLQAAPSTSRPTAKASPCILLVGETSPSLPMAESLRAAMPLAQQRSHSLCGTSRTEVCTACGFGWQRCLETHGHGAVSTGCSRDGQRTSGLSCKDKGRGMRRDPGWGNHWAEPVQPQYLVSAFWCPRQNPPATQINPASACLTTQPNCMSQLVADGWAESQPGAGRRGSQGKLCPPFGAAHLRASAGAEP